MTGPILDPPPAATPTEPGALPRWIQIVTGSMLVLLLLPCLAGSLMMAALPNEAAPVLAPVSGVVMVGMSLWLLALCLRLVRGHTVGGGLMGPRALRSAAWLFLLLPLGGLFTGYFVTHTALALMQSAAYVSIFFGLRSLAADRESRLRRVAGAPLPGPPPGP